MACRRAVEALAGERSAALALFARTLDDGFLTRPDRRPCKMGARIGLGPSSECSDIELPLVPFEVINAPEPTGGRQDAGTRTREGMADGHSGPFVEE